MTIHPALLALFLFLYYLWGMLEDGYNGRVSGADWLTGHKIEWVRRDWLLQVLYFWVIVPWLYDHTPGWFASLLLVVVVFGHYGFGQLIYKLGEGMRIHYLKPWQRAQRICEACAELQTKNAEPKPGKVERWIWQTLGLSLSMLVYGLFF